jgi:hypothetical protein
MNGGPAFVAVTNDGSLGLVGQQASGDVTFLEIPAPHNVLGKVHVGGKLQFVLAGPFPPLVSGQGAQIIMIVIYIVAGVLLVGGIVWLVWWMRRRERHIREAQALDKQAFSKAGASQDGARSPAPPGGKRASSAANSLPRGESAEGQQDRPKAPRKRGK